MWGTYHHPVAVLDGSTDHAGLLELEEALVPQGPHVVADVGERHPELARQLLGRRGAFFEQAEDADTERMGERLHEAGFEIVVGLVTWRVPP
jgi:N-acyl-D-aspartate/D-glutamate deacylase